jgi:hypothetical protein
MGVFDFLLPRGEGMRCGVFYLLSAIDYLLLLVRWAVEGLFE